MARRGSRGFSLVEMLVAVAFTAILMAGMAVVFRSGITSFYASGEKLESLRRNRISLDLLYDDLNNAGMSLVDITTPLTSSDANSNPAFYIIPNVHIQNAGAAPDPQLTDQLYMAFDQPLPFDGTFTSGLGTGGIGQTATQKVLNQSGADLTTTDTSDTAFKINCGDPSYALMVKPGMKFVIKDNLGQPALDVTDVAPENSGSSVIKGHVSGVLTTRTQVGLGGDPSTQSSYQHIAGSAVVFIQPSQMVRYQVVMLNLDPARTVGVPCLVREQGTFDTNNAFTPDASLTQVIAENVVGFKVYLSADSGANWAGSTLSASTTGFTSGWTGGILSDLNNQLLAVGRQDHTSTAGDPAWYRNNPVLVRLDVTTRTATQRAEFSATGTTLSYKTLTQSLVLVPRHFGLPLS